jgi:uncharacterized protein YjbJ (UPF0337 family)
MKSGTRDQVEGKLHEAKGHVKETVGELINDPYLEVEGNIEKKEGKVQDKVGQIKKVVEK